MKTKRTTKHFDKAWKETHWTVKVLIFVSFPIWVTVLYVLFVYYSVRVLVGAVKVDLMEEGKGV